MARTPRRRAVAGRPDFIAAVGELLNDLAPFGYEPTLVGGMALVTLGSTRVTRDFDFLVLEAAREQTALIEVFYRHGFELVSRTDEHGNVVRTIDSREVAAARLRIDRPSTAYFFNRGLGLRVDLLFDFPLQAREVRRGSRRTKIQSYAFHIASRDDLIRMKEMAARDRRNPADLQDLAFLRTIADEAGQ
jgi:hypothetical protein